MPGVTDDPTAVADAADHRHRHRRRQALVRGIVTAVAHRGVALVVAFVSVPLTIGYLGVERFGIWALVSSMLAWLRLADVGIGNGLNGAISTAHAQGRPDVVREHVSTALVLLTGLAVVVGGLGLVVVHTVDWTSLLGLGTAAARKEIVPTVMAVVVIFGLSLPLSVGARVCTALQHGGIANAFGVAGNLVSLGALVVVTRTDGGLPVLVLAVFGSVVVADLAACAWVFYGRTGRVRPSWRAWSSGSARVLLGTGLQFFLVQVMALIVFEFDNFVIAHELGAADVGPYNIAYKLFSYAAILQTLAFSYLWVAYSEAIARGDLTWVRTTFRWHLRLSVLVTTSLSVVLLVAGRPIIEVWAGEEFRPTLPLMALLLAWNVILAFSSPAACIFAAADHMRAQVVYGAVAAVCNVVLSIWWVRLYGVDGVIAATVVSYLLVVCTPTALDVRRLFRGKLAA